MTDMSRYAQRGVSAGKEEVHDAVKNLDKGLFPNAVCKILPDFFSNDETKCLVKHADGAGTKILLAYVYWRETGDMSVWEGIAQDSFVMNLDDLLCVGVTSNIAVSTTINRNKHLIPGEVIAAMINGVQKMVDKMNEHGILIYNAGGETADVGDLVRTITLDNDFMASIKRDQVIDNKIRAGDVIVGLSSSGRATYETEYNSGMGSNGLTSARHDLFNKEVAKKYPESYDPNTDQSLIWSGSLSLTTPVTVDDGLTVDAAKLVLSPTRTYAPIIKKILDRFNNDNGLHGIVHCTGGGQTKVLHYVSDDVKIVKDNLLPVPILFQMIQKYSNTVWQEMYKVYNCGHRMELYVDPAIADDIIEIANSFNVDAQVVGSVEKNTTGTKSLVINSENGIFHY
jgi:phosphoribosylformylglycinamidine cyclo-ligase